MSKTTLFTVPVKANSTGRRSHDRRLHRCLGQSIPQYPEKRSGTVKSKRPLPTSRSLTSADVPPVAGAGRSAWNSMRTVTAPVGVARRLPACRRTRYHRVSVSQLAVFDEEREATEMSASAMMTPAGTAVAGGCAAGRAGWAKAACCQPNSSVRPLGVRVEYLRGRPTGPPWATLLLYENPLNGAATATPSG